MHARRLATVPLQCFDSSALMESDDNIQMLADMDNSVMFHTTGLADDSTLCAKKDIIIAKFDQLLKKLGGEVFTSNPR